MKVLHVTSHLNVGGITSYVLLLSRALSERGNRVLIASGGGQMETRARAQGLTHWKVPLHTSVEFSPQVFAAERMLSRRLREDPVDLLHAHTRVGQVVGERLSRRFKIPFVTTWHGFFRPNLGRFLWPCTGDATIAISEPVRQHLLNDFHVLSQRIRLIRHGIDPEPFVTPVDPTSQRELRERLRIPSSTQVVGTIARLVASRKISQLIRAFIEVRQAIPGAHLLVVGDGEEKTRLEQLAKASGLGEAVHFSGTLPETHVALSLMDAFVFLPAEREGFGLSLLEAMASARPVVAVRRGEGASWVLRESNVGVLVEPQDMSGLAQALLRVLEDKKTACQMGEKARQALLERYSLARMVGEVEALYQDVCSEYRGDLHSR